MSEAQKIGEEIEHAGHTNKRIAILIAVLALGLALADTGGKGAQTAAINENVDVTNLWAFFQAKTIRMTTLHTAAEAVELDIASEKNPAIRTAKTKRVEEWKKAAERYNSEPETKEGRKELAERAHEASERRETAMARYHQFEIASAALQVGIVLASASIITGVLALTWLAGGLGLTGLGFMGIAVFAPHAVHLL